MQSTVTGARCLYHYEKFPPSFYPRESFPGFILILCYTKMEYLHAAVIEDFEECLISATEEGLRKQVIVFLIHKNITPPTDEEWAVCILAKVEDNITIENLVAVGMISYYRVESKL